MAKRKTDQLARKKPTLQLRPTFVLFCEGKRTEPEYFKALGRTLRSAHVEVKISPVVGVPMTIAKASTERAKQAHWRKNAPASERDQIWAVFDRDEHPRFEEAIALCQNGGVKVARSNPCFEVWLILHFEECPKPLSRQEAQQRVAHLCQEYVRYGSKTVDFAKLTDRIDKAEDRAEKHLAAGQEHGSQFGPSSTTVHLLTRAIRAKT